MWERGPKGVDKQNNYPVRKARFSLAVLKGSPVIRKGFSSLETPFTEKLSLGFDMVLLTVTVILLPSRLVYFNGEGQVVLSLERHEGVFRSTFNYLP